MLPRLPLLLPACALACATDPTNPCPAYSGLGTDRGWTWSDGDSSWTVTSTTEGDAAEATVTVDDDRGATTRYRCTADGLFLERASTDDGTDWSTTDYEPPPRVLPATIEVGKAWTAESAVETLDSQGAATFGSAALQFEVIEAGVATVDAGTFEVLRVRVTREDASSIVEARDADVGAVAIEGAEVVALE